MPIRRNYTPPTQETLLDFPLGGVDEERAHGRQPRGTTPDALNVRGFEWATDRGRGGSRPGLDRFLPDPINATRLGNRRHSIQNITEIVTGQLDNIEAPAGVGRSVASSGNQYAVLTPAGVSYFTGGGIASTLFSCSCWGPDDDLYVAMQNSEVPRADFYRANTGDGGSESWVSATSITGVSVVAGMKVIGRHLYVAATHDDAPNGRIYKIQTWDGAIVGSTFWLSETQISGLTFAVNSINCLAAVEHLLGVVASGAFLVIDTETASLRATLANVGTTARAPKADSDGSHFYATCNETTKLLKKIRADGTLVWSYTLTDTENAVCYDGHTGKVFVAQRTTGTVLVIDSGTGDLLETINPGSFGSFDDVDSDWAGNLYYWRDGETGNDVVSRTEDNSANFAVTIANETHTGSSVNRGRRQVRPVRRRILVQSGGRLSRVSEPDPDTGRRATTPVTDGERWRSTADVIFDAQNGLFMYYVDGVSYSRYSAATNSCVDWTPTAGSLPRDAAGRAARLICTWRGRTVVSGLQGDPQNWFMSAQDDPLDWDYSPAALTPGDAVAGNNAPAGLVGDKINCLIAYDDDRLVFGGDHTIWMMSGDPAAGGSILNVSDSIGMAWGRPFCRTPDGTIYFFANRGGVFSLVPGSKPQRVSQQITQRLNQVDVGASQISMAWDDRAQGIHLWITSLAGPAVEQHYFYDLRLNAWWPVELAHEDFNPKCCYALDGDDPDDRVVLIGSWDSHIRSVSSETGLDDRRPFDSYVVYGPIQSRDGGELTLHELQPTFAENSGAVSWEVMTGTTAESALVAAPVAADAFAAGRNSTHPVRKAGYAVYVKLLSSVRWAIETMRAKTEAHGMTRRRGF